MNSVFDQSLMKRKFEEGPPMAVYLVVAPDLWATFPSTSTAPEAGPDFTDLMKQLIPSGTCTLSTPGSPAPAPAPAPAHNNNIFTFSATSSSTSAAPPPSQVEIPDFMKQLALSLSRTFTLSALNSPAPPQAHNNNMFTFSSTPIPPDFTHAMKKFKPSSPSRHSTTSATPKARLPYLKKFKPSPRSRRSASATSSAPKSGIHDLDAKFNNLMTNLMEQFTLSPPSGTFSFSSPSTSAPAQVNDSRSTTLKATAPAQVNDNMYTPKATDDDESVSRCIYDDLDPFYLSPEFVIPPHIKEFCELALENYNNENGTSYKYVSPVLVEEDKKSHVTSYYFSYETSHYFSFTASTSGCDDCETFTANFKSGFRYSDGTRYFKELEQVSRLADRN